mgnify:CR=1 FL=1
MPEICVNSHAMRYVKGACPVYTNQCAAATLLGGSIPPYSVTGNPVISSNNSYNTICNYDKTVWF